MEQRLWISYEEGGDGQLSRSGAFQLLKWQHPTAGWVVTVKPPGRYGQNSKKTYKLKANGREYDTEWEIPA